MDVVIAAPPAASERPRRAPIRGLALVLAALVFGVALWAAMWLPSYSDAVAFQGPIGNTPGEPIGFSCPPLGENPIYLSYFNEGHYLRPPCEEGRSRRRITLAFGEAIAALAAFAGSTLYWRDREALLRAQ